MPTWQAHVRLPFRILRLLREESARFSTVQYLPQQLPPYKEVSNKCRAACREVLATYCTLP